MMLAVILSQLPEISWNAPAFRWPLLVMVIALLGFVFAEQHAEFPLLTWVEFDWVVLVTSMIALLSTLGFILYMT